MCSNYVSSARMPSDRSRSDSRKRVRKEKKERERGEKKNSKTAATGSQSGNASASDDLFDQMSKLIVSENKYDGERFDAGLGSLNHEVEHLRSDLTGDSNMLSLELMVQKRRSSTLVPGLKRTKKLLACSRPSSMIILDNLGLAMRRSLNVLMWQSLLNTRSLGRILTGTPT